MEGESKGADRARKRERGGTALLVPGQRGAGRTTDVNIHKKELTTADIKLGHYVNEDIGVALVPGIWSQLSA